VGICLFPDQAADPGEMQRRAHLAMYSAKAGSESKFAFYQDLDDDRPTRDLVVLTTACMQDVAVIGDHPLNLV
jgi:GGDEF domain-containing protein